MSKLMLPLLVSSSAWLKSSVDTSELVTDISANLGVRHGTYRSDVPAYYLFDMDELAGHVCFFKHGRRYWMDKVFLEEPYRGTGLAEQFLEIALEHFTKDLGRPILVDGFYKHAPLYASLGFKQVPRESSRYAEDLEWHYETFKYTHPKRQYRLMMLNPVPRS